jgi:hypothetical protein
MDMATLCEHICVSSGTVDNWVAQGILPPPRKRGGKLMWKWAEVDERLTVGTDDNNAFIDAAAERMRLHAQKDPGSKARRDGRKRGRDDEMFEHAETSIFGGMRRRQDDQDPE